MSAALSRIDPQMLALDASGAVPNPADPRAMAEIAARFGHFHLDIATWTISWSVGVAHIFGRPLPASGVLDLDEHLACYHPDDAAVSRAALSAALAGDYLERPYRTQGRVIRPDGTMRYVLAQGVGRGDGRGRLAATYGIFVDVSETVEAERSARENGRLLRATFEAMDQGILMVGADQRVRVMNGKAKELLGLPEHLAQADTPFAAVLRHQEENGEFADLSASELSCLPIWSDEANARPYTRRRPNGTVLDIRTAPMDDGGFVRTYSDVTEQVRRENALRLSEQRLAFALDSGGDGVWT